MIIVIDYDGNTANAPAPSWKIGVTAELFADKEKNPSCDGLIYRWWGAYPTAMAELDGRLQLGKWSKKVVAQSSLEFLLGMQIWRVQANAEETDSLAWLQVFAVLVPQQGSDPQYAVNDGR